MDRDETRASEALLAKFFRRWTDTPIPDGDAYNVEEGWQRLETALAERDVEPSVQDHQDHSVPSDAEVAEGSDRDVARHNRPPIDRFRRLMRHATLSFTTVSGFGAVSAVFFAHASHLTPLVTTGVLSVNMIVLIAAIANVALMARAAAAGPEQASSQTRAAGLGRVLLAVAVMPAVAIAGAYLTGVAGMAVVALLMLAAIPLLGHTGNQRALTRAAVDLATSVEELALLKSGSAGPRRLRSAEELPAGLTPDAAAPMQAEPNSFWSTLTETEQRALQDIAQHQIFPAGAELSVQGGIADHVMIIRSGHVKIHIGQGRHERIIAMRGPGDIVGERAALQVSSRTSSVTALDTVHAMLIPAESFAAFVQLHPRVLSEVEHQVYQRLTEDPGSRPLAETDDGSSPLHIPQWITSHRSGQNCTILCVDIAHFGATHRTDRDRRNIREVMYRLLRDAFADADIPWNACHIEDRGDGALIVVPPDTPTAAVAERVVRHLTARLALHNQLVDAGTRIQLRAAIDVGPVDFDSHGVVGSAIDRAARLLEAPGLKQRIAETGAAVGVIASTFVYDNVLSWGSIPYEPIEVSVKETNLTGWISLHAALL